MLKNIQFDEFHYRETTVDPLLNGHRILPSPTVYGHGYVYVKGAAYINGIDN